MHKLLKTAVMIEVQNLTYTYPKNSEPTVKGINFKIGKGEIFGFLGPSGAGKSTTQKVLIKLLNGFVGDIRVLGKSLEAWDKSYYNQIGVGFELPNHYLKLTGIENLRFFASFYDRPSMNPLELLAMVGLEKDAHKKVEAYSKGMKMRLNFVRSIMHNPDILFFDEPTSGLDPANARQMKDIILDLKTKGKTIFITTHLMQDADELCDRIAFIVEGQIALIDSPKALKLQYGKRKLKVEYFNGQLQQSEFELDGLGENTEFLKIIKEADIHTMHTEEATLESIFIEVTGERLKKGD